MHVSSLLVRIMEQLFSISLPLNGRETVLIWQSIYAFHAFIEESVKEASCIAILTAHWDNLKFDRAGFPIHDTAQLSVCQILL